MDTAYVHYGDNVHDIHMHTVIYHHELLYCMGVLQRNLQYNVLECRNIDLVPIHKHVL